MGTIYYVGCRDCKIIRDLGKFYTMRVIENKEEALEFSKDIQMDSFRVGLLVSFLYEHEGHNCTVFDEHAELKKFDTYESPAKMDHDFFRDD